jgi:hypothetical protein
MTKHEILTSALEGREQEVLGYQINIDNYRLAIEYIGTLPDADQAELAEFKNRLTATLAAEIHEQKKAKVMLAVIQSQLE